MFELGFWNGIGLRSALVFGLAVAAWAGVPADARACGGFFCSQGSPVNQQAERIIFSKNPDGSVTAVVEILYDGPSERFAWLLPISGSPEVKVSSDVVFDRLQQATSPSYQLSTSTKGDCGGGSGGGCGAGSDALAASPGAGRPTSAARDAGVQVVNEGTVGPYDFTVISLDRDLPDAAMVAVEWLEDHDYDVTNFGADRLRPYLENGKNLLAFRLTKGTDTGAIRPIRVTFETDHPTIPIRPTAVAANDDMGVLVWVLGEHRAVPLNYRMLELNQALINWTNPGSTYTDVVSAAADEAGGQGFVTEMAGETGDLADTIYDWSSERRWMGIKSGVWTDREGELFTTVVRRFGNWDGMREVVRELPLPLGTTAEDAVSCPICVFPEGQGDIEGFEPNQFLESVQRRVIEPVVATADLFDERAYVTRLFTTLSPDEMTKDPKFGFNPDLGDKSSVHRAERVIYCNSDDMSGDLLWHVDLPQGGRVYGRGIALGSAWPFDVDTADQPASRRILQADTSGEPEVVDDHGDAIEMSLNEQESDLAPNSGGCAVDTGVGSTAGLMLFAIGLLWIRRWRTMPR